MYPDFSKQHTEYKNKHSPWEAGHSVGESEPPRTGPGETHLSPFADFVLPLLKRSSLVTDLGCFFSFHMDVYSYKFHLNTEKILQNLVLQFLPVF